MNKSDFIIVYEGKYVGLETKAGEEVLPCKYDKILDFDDDGYVRFIKNSFYGTVDLLGNICISLSDKLTHLGVFYKGTARAKRDELWGLVDVYGKAVTDFVYKTIDAHRKNGYSAVTLKGKKGQLLENGEFKTDVKQKKKQYYSSFEEHLFLNTLAPWLGGCTHPIKFYYRDTDADIDIKKIYKRGRFIRTDDSLVVTQKLLRPVHKIRFLIAARKFLTINSEFQNRLSEASSLLKENMIPANSNFLVVDVQQCGGVTQIVLLHFPHGAMLLAKKHKVKFSKYNPKDKNDVDLKKAAAYDLQDKLNECVHGHSLNKEWIKTMYQPIGLDKNMKPNKLIMHVYSSSDFESPNMNAALRSLQDRDEDWNEEHFHL